MNTLGHFGPVTPVEQGLAQGQLGEPLTGTEYENEVPLHCGRRQPSNISFNYFYGAQVGSYITCSWFSYVELDTSENTAELMLPAGTWTEFDFPTGSSVSSANYYHNMWLEKLYQSSSLLGLRLYEPNGAYAEYTNLYNGVYFMTGEFDSDGNKTGYGYTNNLLSTVTAADGTTFQLYYNDSNDGTLVTAVTNSFGTSVTLARGETGPAGTSSTIDELTSITDAAGITSHIWYAYQYAFPVTQLVTPYGTTAFEFDINGNLGVFNDPPGRDDRDRRHCLDLLAGRPERFGSRLHAYVLMPNHYHLLVETPEDNLSRLGQWLNVSYSVRFNRRYQRSGHLFQGRFAAILIEDGWYTSPPAATNANRSSASI